MDRSGEGEIAIDDLIIDTMPLGEINDAFDPCTKEVDPQRGDS